MTGPVESESLLSRWRHIWPCKAEPAEGTLAGFQHQLLVVLAVIMAYGGVLSILQLANSPATITGGLVMAAAAAAVAGTALVVERRRPHLAACVLTVGSLAFIIGLASLYREPNAYYLVSIPLFASGVLLGVGPQAVLGVLVVAIAMQRRGLPLLPEPFPVLVPLLGTFLLLGLLTRRTVDLGCHWERQVASIQRELVTRLRARQGELNASLKALDQTAQRLKRANEELADMRHRLEETRMLQEQSIANVSHELRTPLNLIVGFAELMYLSPGRYGDMVWNADLVSDIGRVYRASQQLQKLINDLLDMARIGTVHLPSFRELLDVRSLIDGVIENVMALVTSNGLRLEKVYPKELPLVYVDGARITQVLHNLLNNAIRFTDAGTITVRVEADETAVTVSVTDTGIGIHPEELERLFRPFAQTQAAIRRGGGTGLGLALSKELVALHGGRMWAESQVGVGSTFAFSLPLPGATAQVSPLYSIPPNPAPAKGVESIVFVDRDLSLAQSVGRFLGDKRVIPVQTIAAAEERILAEHPLAVIVNNHPHTPPEDWFEPIGEISQRYSVPIIRCSIPSQSWLLAHEGIDDFLLKPVSQESLRHVLARNGCLVGTALVVDDDPGCASLLTRMLETLGFGRDILVAYSGTDAVRIAADARPDLVLLDLIMPGMDGFATARELRQQPALRATKMVAISALSPAQDGAHTLGGPLTLLQGKGIPSAVLVPLLRSVLDVVRPDYAADANTLRKA
ncbi:MAG: ATP-binding protein [Anaerolineae bacterium]